MTARTVALLDESSVVGWAREHGVVPRDAAVTARPLSGGISNVVLALAWADGGAVVKQSLPELRVAQRWEFDRARVVTERKAIEYLATVIPDRVPEIVAFDDDDFAFAMTVAPPGGRVWKQQLLSGELDAATARSAGETLARIQLASRRDRDLLRAFDDRMPLVQGRLDPYHRTAAALIPDVAETVVAHAEQLLDARDVLVLGDYAPKNLLAYPDMVFVIDLEVAHLGAAAFDVAFLLTHLVLKQLVLPGRSRDLHELARAFWDAYAATAAALAASDDDVRVALGSLLLARVDGKSPVEYLGAHAAEVRSLARWALLDMSGCTVHEVLTGLFDSPRGAQ